MKSRLEQPDAVQVFVEGMHRSTRDALQRWKSDSREAMLEDLSLQMRSLLYLEGDQRETAEKEYKWTKVQLRNTKGPEAIKKPRRNITVKDDGTQSSSEKNGLSSQKWGTQFVNQVESNHLRTVYESDFCFMNSDTYRQTWYSSNHVTSAFCPMMESTQFLQTHNPKSEASL